MEAGIICVASSSGPVCTRSAKSLQSAAGPVGIEATMNAKLVALTEEQRPESILRVNFEEEPFSSSSGFHGLFCARSVCVSPRFYLSLCIIL